VAARLRAVKRAIESLGGVCERPVKGSHWKARLSGKMFPLPAHNGEKSEVSDRYIRSLCRCFGLDEELFREML
jgi:hypothetical protein